MQGFGNLPKNTFFLVLGFDEVFFQRAELLIGQLLPQKEFLWTFLVRVDGVCCRGVSHTQPVSLPQSISNFPYNLSAGIPPSLGAVSAPNLSTSFLLKSQATGEISLALKAI